MQYKYHKAIEKAPGSLAVFRPQELFPSTDSSRSRLTTKIYDSLWSRAESIVTLSILSIHAKIKAAIQILEAVNDSDRNSHFKSESQFR